MGNIFSCDIDHKKQYDEIIQNINIVKETLYRFDRLHNIKKQKLASFVMILNDSHQDLSKRQKVLEKIILELNSLYDGFDLQILRQNIIYISEQIGLFMSTVDTVQQQKHLLALKKAEITLSNQITHSIEEYVNVNKDNLQPLFDQIRDTILDEKSTVFNNIRQKFNEMKKRELSQNAYDITKKVDYLSKYFPKTYDQNQFLYDDDNYYDLRRQEMYRNKKYESPYRDTDYFDTYNRGQSLYRKNPYYDTDPVYSRYSSVPDKMYRLPNESNPYKVPNFESIQKSRKFMAKKPEQNDLNIFESSKQSLSQQSLDDKDELSTMDRNKQLLTNKYIPMENIYKKYSPENKKTISPIDKSTIYPKSPFRNQKTKPSGSKKSVRFIDSPGVSGYVTPLSRQSLSKIPLDREKTLLSSEKKKFDNLSRIYDASQDQVSPLTMGSLKSGEKQKKKLFLDEDDFMDYGENAKKSRKIKRKDIRDIPFFENVSIDDNENVNEQNKNEEIQYEEQGLQTNLKGDTQQILKQKSMYETPLKNVYKKKQTSPSDKSTVFPEKRENLISNFLSESQNRTPLITDENNLRFRNNPSRFSKTKSSISQDDDDVQLSNRERKLLSSGKKDLDILSTIYDDSQNQVSPLTTNISKERENEKFIPNFGYDDDSVGYSTNLKKSKRRKSDSTLPLYANDDIDIYQEQKDINDERLSNNALKILGSSKKGRGLKKTLSVLDDFRESL